ncbi:iron-dicitrate transporter ATP-binding subunit [Actinotalea ferrariae CF5-4]|uniref:Iron-dicitrate transporter ATP-binding subunit n=1 Tax=Actinotalea ferrariae CF5-4 TaxID=948458 RepID=A0A021VLU5_9CELL|nr:ABC transporter ATP-binding protein [Actinotalea ferrariae]EYR62146.1 iron-dicitrate transporter ATP-binding subunit [Actinotalea ferrariae CF5-4]
MTLLENAPARAVTGWPAPALRGEHLRLAYGRDAVVVHDATVDLRAGEVTVLAGPNGSGKSTLLRALARLHTPTAGTVALPDGDARALDARAFARRVTLLSQNRPVPGGVTVREVVEYGRHPHRPRWRGTDDDGPRAVAWAMGVTGVNEMADRPADELSGGELQRVWLASCLAQDTHVLLLDEPTNHLDLRYQVEVLDLVRDLAEEHGVAVGVVLHDLEQAARVADRLVLLHRGVVVGDGVPEEVLAAHTLTEVYGLPVEVSLDAHGHVRIHPVGRTRRPPRTAPGTPVR